MRNTQAHSLNEVINELIDAYRLRGKMAEAQIRDSCEQVMGKAISNRTHSIYLHDKVITIHLNSSVLREELNFKKAEIIKALNKVVESDAVSDIVFR